MRKSFLGTLCLILICFCYSSSQELVPGDGIRIIFYNINEQITGDYFIEQDCNLRLPFLGRIDVRRKTFDSLSQEIYTKYAHLYESPEITILPLFKVNILGEVNNPGFYYVTGIEKLSDLLAKAGGLTSDANVNDIFISRDYEDVEIDGEEIIRNGNKLNDIGLKSGDRIFVSREWWVSARNSTFILSALAILITLATLFIK